MASPTRLADADMRAALARRDRAFDGRFVYGVASTGIYCRPSCPARTPRPENLRFFAGPAEADQAGFRPCKRCRPDAPRPDVERMTEVARFIEAHAEESLSLSRLAARQAVSPAHLQRTFKSVFGVSPKAYQDAARLKRLKGRLKAGDDVAGAIYEAGYGSPSRVYEAADRGLGMTPGAYRTGGAGEEIVYACRFTSYGLLMMAATGAGVCFAMFGKDDAALLNALTAEFPKARFAPAASGAALEAWIEALEAHLSAGAPAPEIPLDLRGTAFQIKVWRFLTSVPDGATVAYAEVAAGAGRPRAVRAAASACGRNRIAVLIPCHRALRGDGGLGGYRWGLARKRALLAAERKTDPD